MISNNGKQVSALRLNNVSHNYTVEQTGETLRALDNISITIAPGEIVSIVGPSGCGKSTLIRVAAGLISPTIGTASVNDSSPESARRAHSISLVAQEPILFPWLTVAENLAFPLRIIGRFETNLVERMVDFVLLRNYARLFPSQLSGGMRSRVALARALITEPAILLLDEPFGALDELTSLTLCKELLRLWSSSSPATVLVTHNVTQAVFLSHRVLVFSQRPGKIVEEVETTFGEKRDDSLLSTPEFVAKVAHVRSLLT